jgi:filamentous hemagglutinin
VGGSVGAEGNVSISSAQGAITVDREIGASKGFAQLAAQTGVTTGNITSLTGFVDVQAKTGPVQVGDLYGLVGKPAPTTGPADPCAGNAICVQAGTGGTATSTTNYTVSTGTIRTDNTASGNVLVGGANGVQTGAIDINNGSVALNSSQGAINVGSVGLSGSSIGKSVVANARGKVTMGNITAGSGSIDLQSANDELVLARVSGGGDVRLRSAANLTVDLSKVDAGGVASFTSTGGELRVGTVSGSNFTPGDLNQTLGAVELSGQTGVTVGNVAARDGASLQSAAGSINAGEVVSSGGAVQVTAANDVNLRRAQGTAATIASNTGRIRVGTTSGSSFVGGNVNATTGAASVSARTGVEAADITGGTTATVNVAEGAVVARALFAGNGAAFVSGRDGVSVTSASAPKGSIDLIADRGAVKVGSTSGSTFSGGQVNAGRGGVGIDARDEIATGNVTASNWVKIGSESSKVSLGNVSASAAHSSDDECNGKSVCIGAAFDSANGSGQTLTVGSVTASAGDVLLFSRNGVTANGAVTVSRGELVVSGGSGAVTASGALTTGTGATTDANYGVKVDGASLALQNVTASGNIDLAANSTTGTITTGTLAARRNLTVQSIGGFAVGGDKIAGTPESVRLTSSAGSVCVGTVVDGRCTGSTLTRDTTLVIDGATGVTTGDLSVRSVNVSAAGGSATLGQVTTTGAVSVSARDALSARGVVATGSVRLASTNDAVRVTETITSQQSSVTVAAKGLVETGNVTAGTFLDMQSRAGALKTGNLAARSAQTATTSATANTTNPCIGTAICIQTGTDSAAANPAALTASVGAVEAAAGNVRLDGRGGVEAGSVLANAGSVVFSSSDGGVRAATVRAAAPVSVVTASAATVASEVPRSTVAASVTSSSVEALAKGSIILGDVTSAGAVTLQSVEGSGGVTAGSIDAGTSAAVSAGQGTVTVAKVAAKSGNLKVVGKNAVKTGDVTGSAAVDLASESGTLESSAVNAGGVAKLAGASGVTVASIKGASVDAQSSGGGVTVGTGTGSSFVAGTVTATSGAVNVAASKDVIAGVIDAATSATVSAAQGAVTLAIVAAKSDDLKVVGKNAVKTGDITGNAAVEVVSESGTLESSAVKAGGVAKLTGASGIKLASIRGGAVDATSNAGSVAVTGGVTSTTAGVKLEGRDGVTSGAIDAATSATVSAAQGAVTLANVAAKSGDLKIVGKNAVKTGDVTGSAGVELASDSSALDAGAVTAGGTAKLSGVSGIKLASIRGGAVDATSSAGSVAVTGGVTSTTAGVKLDGRDGVTSGAIDAATSATVTAAQGAVAVAAVNAGGALAVSGSNGVSVASARGGSVDMLASAGAIRVGTGTGSDFVAGSVTSTAGGVGLVGRDGVTVGAIDAATSVRLRADAGRVTVGRVRAFNGLIDIASRDDGSSGELEASEDISVVSTNGNVRVGGAKSRAVVVTAARDVAVAGAVNAERGAAFTAGSRFANTAAVRVTNGTPGDGSGPSGFGGIDIRAADAEVGAELFVRGAGVNIRGTGAGGVVIGDGVTAPAGALQLSNAEVQRIDAGSLAIRSGPSTASGRDLVVGDLSLDRSKIPQLLLSTGKGGQVRVTGAVRGSGAPAVSIGESTVRPDGVEITGSLGATDAALGTVQIRSGADVLIGTQGFVDAAKAAADKTTFDVQSASVANAGTGNTRRLFLVAGATAFDAPGFILQQNTGTSGNNGDGLRIGVPSGDVTATFANGTAPRRIAVFGSVVDADGKALTSSSAAVAKGLLPANVTANDVWRLNTCIIGTGAACAATNLLPPPTQLVQPPVTPPPAAPATPSTQTSPTASTAPRATSTSSSSSGSSSSGSSSGSSSSGSSGSSGSDGSGSSGGSGTSGSSDGGSSGSSDGSNGSSSDDQSASNDESAAEDESDTEDTQEQEPTEEEEQAANEEEATEEAAAQIADAGTQQEEESLKPLEVDAGSRDLLKPDTDGGIREPGVGSANEDLWPQEPLPTPPSTP